MLSNMKIQRNRYDCDKSLLERFLDSLLVSGGGLADGGAFVNRAEGTLPGQLHETHLINTSSHLALQPSE